MKRTSVIGREWNSPQSKKTWSLFPDLWFLQVFQARVVAQPIPHHAAPVAHLAMAKDEEEEEEIGLGLNVRNSIATCQMLTFFVKFYSISLTEPCSQILFRTLQGIFYSSSFSLPPVSRISSRWHLTSLGQRSRISIKSALGMCLVLGLSPHSGADSCTQAMKRPRVTLKSLIDSAPNPMTLRACS